MLATQIISLVVVALLPAVFVAAAYLAKIPERQYQLLAQFAAMAVQQIEQQHTELHGDAKKQLARAFLARSFKAVHLPPPPDEIIDAAIEAAVFSLPKTQ